MDYIRFASSESGFVLLLKSIRYQQACVQMGNPHTIVSVYVGLTKIAYSCQTLRESIQAWYVRIGIDSAEWANAQNTRLLSVFWGDRA